MTSASNGGIDPDQFECAVVRLVSFQPARLQAGQLLFASVTLLARGRQRPPSSVGVELAKVPRSEGRLYFRRAVLGVVAALRWYRALGTETGNRTPIPELLRERDGKLDGIEISVASLIDRPAWPRLGLSLGRDLAFASDELAQPCPFVGSVPSRVHRRFGSCSGFQGVIDQPACIRQLQQWIHFDLSRYPEYAGGAVLVVPDPFVRRIDSFYVGNDLGGEDHVLRVVPREPGGLRGLSVTLFERQAHMLSRFETHEVPSDGLIVAPSNEALGATGFVLCHEDQGPLQASAATHYMRAVGLSMSIAEPAGIITSPASDSQDSADTSYQATTFTAVNRVATGNSSLQTVDIRIEEAAARRRQAFEATHYEQTWLEARNREAALIFVRSRVHRARQSVLVADPYLGFRQVKQFLFAVSHPGVKITLLTSRLAFESRYAEDGCSATTEDESSQASSMLTTPSSRVEEFSRFDELRNVVDELRKHTRGDVEVRVLPGDLPELHDRFLGVDGAVWFFGGSFNGLGDRASLVVRIPQPDQILAEVAGMVSRARTFDEHVKMRSKPPPPQPDLSWWRRRLLQFLGGIAALVSGRQRRRGG